MEHILLTPPVAEYIHLKGLSFIGMLWKFQDVAQWEENSGLRQNFQTGYSWTDFDDRELAGFTKDEAISFAYPGQKKQGNYELIGTFYNKILLFTISQVFFAFFDAGRALLQSRYFCVKVFKNAEMGGGMYDQPYNLCFLTIIIISRGTLIRNRYFHVIFDGMSTWNQRLLPYVFYSG